MTPRVWTVLSLAMAMVACDGTPVTGPLDSRTAEPTTDGMVVQEHHSARSESVGSTKYAHLLMTCNTMVGTYEVDPSRAAEVLPDEYTLALHTSADGSRKGLVYLQTSTCDGTGNGEHIAPFGLADAWLIIEGPPEVDEVPGAVATLPTLYVYVLKAQTTSKWIKANTGSIYFAKELVRDLALGGPTPPRAGEVFEMSGRGYRWEEFAPCAPLADMYAGCWMLPPPDPTLPVGYGLPAFPMGINVKGFINQGNGKVATKDMSCLAQMFGQGLIRLDVDAKSHLMDSGVFGPTQIGYAFDGVFECDLLMEPL